MSYFIPETLLNSFRTALLVPNSERVIALIDFKTFGSKKEGVVISEKGLYWHSKADNPCQISWSSLKSASILSVDKTSLTIGGMILNTRTSKFDKVTLLDLLNRIKELLEN